MNNTNETNRAMPHVAIYARVSTEEQAREGFSIKVQPQQCIEELEKRFGRNGFTHESFSDAGKSGSSGPRPWEPDLRKRGDRKGLHELFEGLRQKRFTHIVALRRDRIYRNIANWLAFKAIMLQGVDLIFVLEPDEDDSPSGELASGMIAYVAQYELDKTRENVKNALRKRVAQGYKLGAELYGWRKQESHEVEAGKRKSIVPIEEELSIVRQVKDWYLSGMSYAQIADKLNDLGVPRRIAKGKKWESSTIRILLSNPTHAGLIKNADGDLVPAEFYESRAYDPEVYYRIQQVKAERNRRFKGLAATEPHRLFAKVVSCGICSKALRSMMQGDGYAYRCNQRRFGPAQGHVYIAAKTLEKAILSELERVSQLPDVLSEAENCIREYSDSNAGQLEAELRRLKQHVAVLDCRKKELQRSVVRGEIQPKEFQPISDCIEEARSGPLASITELEMQLTNRTSHEETCRRAIEALRSFPTLWGNLTDTEKREFLRIVVEKAVLNKDENEMWLELKLCMLDEVRIAVPRRAIDGRYERPPGAEGLTERQLAILWHVLQGRGPKEIASHFEVTPTSVNEMGRKIRQHLGVADLVSAAAMAQEAINRYERFLPVEGAYFRKYNSLRLRVTEYRVLTALAAGSSWDDICQQAGMDLPRLKKAFAKAVAKLGTDDPKEMLRIAKDRNLLPSRLKRKDENGKDLL